MDERQLKGKRVFWSNKWDKLWLLIIPVGLLTETLAKPSTYDPFWFWVIVLSTSSFILYVLYHMFHPKFIWVDTNTTEGKIIQAEVAEKIYSDHGVFTYHENGFDFEENRQTSTFLWVEIESILVYKKDLYAVDELNLDVLFVNNFRLHLTEEIPGWYQFIDKLKLVFPTIDKDFEAALMFPPFETNLTLIYDSKGRALEEVLKKDKG